jgi:hypothetical protein
MQIQNTNNILLPQDLSRCGQISFLKQLLTAVAFFLLKIESLVWLGTQKKVQIVNTTKISIVHFYCPKILANLRKRI